MSCTPAGTGRPGHGSFSFHRSMATCYPPRGALPLVHLALRAWEHGEQTGIFLSQPAWTIMCGTSWHAVSPPVTWKE